MKNMGIINFIDDGNLSIIQGVNGIKLFNESWMVEPLQAYEDGRKLDFNILMDQNAETLL